MGAINVQVVLKYCDNRKVETYVDFSKEQHFMELSRVRPKKVKWNVLVANYWQWHMWKHGND